MSLIKDTLTVDDLKSNRPAFKNPIQMLVAGSGNKKSVVFPINELEKPTIDSVLNTVPLFYNPITKQLLLQQDLEQRPTKQPSSHSTAVHRKCESLRLTTDERQLNGKSRPLVEPTDKVKKLNNLNELNNRNSRLSTPSGPKSQANDAPVRREERKELLETRLDDFTTKSIVIDGKQSANSLSQRPVEIKLFDAKRSNGSPTQPNKAVNHFKIVTSSPAASPAASLTASNTGTPANRDLNLDKLNLNDKAERSGSSKDFSKGSSPGQTDAGSQVSAEEDKPNRGSEPNKPPVKKDTFKTHRRTPSYIHNFHDVIKNNHSSHSSKSSSAITVSSVSNAIQSLTKTSLANATSTLSNTISTTNAKLNQTGNQMNQSANHLTNGLDVASRTGKQIVFNEAKNELNFYDLDTESETGSVFRSKRYSIDDDSVEPLNLPSPYCEKPKKLSLITSPLQSVLSRLTSKTSSSSTIKPATTESNANEKRRSSKSFDSDAPSHASSTTGLIFENRPFNLPTKSPDEELSHRAQYEQLLRDVKRREQKNAKQVKKNLLRKKKEEERMLSSIKIWQSEVMPRFEELRNTKKVRELWSDGLPPNLRGSIWRMAIGNQLNLTSQCFESNLAKWCHSSLESLQLKDEEKVKENDRIVNCLSKCSDESVYELIKLDVSRTFPSLKLFQKDAPFHDTLLKLLGTWAYYRPDIGYIQGMSFILGRFQLVHL